MIHQPFQGAVRQKRLVLQHLLHLTDATEMNKNRNERCGIWRLKLDTGNKTTNVMCVYRYGYEYRYNIDMEVEI